MAIVKNNFRVSRLKGEVSPRSKESMSTDEDDELHRSKESLSASEFDDDEEEEEGEEEEEDEDADSGMDSDDVDLSELGEIGEELCQVGSQICSVPFQLYDLPGLSEILSIDVWNECLTEEERFGLAKYLPDLEQDSFLRTMKELFTGGNFHFGSPLVKLFDMMKGGLCEPRVMLYQHGWNFFQKFRHYHFLRKYQNSMVGKFVQINNAWLSCKGYSIEERLRVLNLTRSQKSLMYDKREDMGLETDSSGREEVGDGLWARKKGHQPVYVGSPTVDASSQGWAMVPETEKYGKQNRKGMLQLTGSKVSSEDNLMGSYTSSQLVLDQKSRPYDSFSASVAGYDNRISRHGKTVPKGGYGDPLIGVPLSLRHDGIHSQPKNWNAHQIDEMKIERGSPDYTPRDSVKKGKYLDKYPQTSVEAQIYNGRNRTQPPMSKFIPGDGSFGNQNYRRIVPKEEAFSVVHQYEQGDWDIRGDKRKMQPEFLSNKNHVGLDTKARKYGSLHPQVNDMILRTGYGAAKSGKKIKRESLQNGYDMEVLSQSDETESDSSEQVDEGERANLLRSKPGYPSGVLERHGKTNKFPKKDKMFALPHPGAMYSGKSPKDDRGDWLHSQDVEVYTIKGKQKSKILDPRYLHGYSPGILDESSFMEFDKMGGKRGYKSAKTDHMQSESGEKLHRNMLKGNASAKKKKGLVDNEYHVPQSSYARDYMDEDSDLHVTRSPSYLDDAMRTDRLGKKGHSYEAHGTDRHERPNMPLLECSSTSKKRKGKLDATHMSVLGDSEMYSSSQHQLDDPSSLRKRGKREPEMDSDSLAMLSSEKGLVDADADTKPGKKPFPLITPSIHTGFSFSIIHLLSAVRVAMVTPLAGDVSDIGRHIESVDARQNGTHETVGGNPIPHSHDVMDTSISDQAGNKNLPSLTVQEIVNRVRSNPGDPSILETQEPLQDLVRGVLKIFSSKTAPLGAKGWKALVSYEKPTKSWSWIGPVTLTTSDPDSIEEVTSYESWDLPYKMLVKLVDSFANWLKNGQETLQQIGSLPAPPLSLMQPNLDEKERFRDLRAQKSLTTISPSSEEVRAYFRREEILRYSVPDRAFSYTAADGRKSIVAPLRRGGGKPTSKARDHPILKPDRPPHVTILCLVRDAAARLPGSIGTRADVCTLIRDSQYIVEDVTDAQVNQVVSGALDRLHYERDPCVQFDGERKLWVYLHRDREEEDFEDDGTSSTKKWKRPRKDATEQTDSPLANVAYQGTGEQVSGGFGASYMLSDDLKAEPISTHAVDRMDPLIHGLRSNDDGSTGPFVGSDRGRLNQGHSMDWEVLGLNSLRENNMLCQENSTNEDYDDTFSRDRSAGLLGVNINNGVT